MVEEGGSYLGEVGGRVMFQFVTGDFKMPRRRRQ